MMYMVRKEPRLLISSPPRSGPVEAFGKISSEIRQRMGELGERSLCGMISEAGEEVQQDFDRNLEVDAAVSSFKCELTLNRKRRLRSAIKCSSPPSVILSSSVSSRAQRCTNRFCPGGKLEDK